MAVASGVRCITSRMDLTAIDTYLERARRENDVSMRPCGLVTDAFLPLPAHKVGAAHLFLRPRMILADPTGCGKTPQTLVGWAYLKEKQPNLKLLGRDRQVEPVPVARLRHEVPDRGERGRHRLRRAQDQGVSGRSLRRLRPAGARWTSGSRPTLFWPRTRRTSSRCSRTSSSSSMRVHHVDNRKQETLYPCCARFAAKAKAAWGLSATPMDNGRLDEVYSLFDLIRPGTLGDYPTFRKLYFVLRLVRPRWKDKKTGRQARPFYEVLGHQNLPHLAARIDKFYLRRPAEAIRAGLPPITFQIDSIELGTKQQALYDAVYDGQMPGAPDADAEARRAHPRPAGGRRARSAGLRRGRQRQARPAGRTAHRGSRRAEGDSLQQVRAGRPGHRGPAADEQGALRTGDRGGHVEGP